ncbi:MAG TPA: zinc ribbon domain-containing protein [Ignavibacteria bacterium]
MPTYEYICQNCHHEFEKIQSIKDEPLKKCPNCHKDSLKKVISGGVGLIFKGSGFYITDYKNKGASETKKHPTIQKSSKKETKSSKSKSRSKDT